MLLSFVSDSLRVTKSEYLRNTVQDLTGSVTNIAYTLWGAGDFRSSILVIEIAWIGDTCLDILS